MTKVLLYSGGMDSWLIAQLWKPDIKLYVNMSTKYSQAEINRLPKDVIIEKLDLGGFEREDSVIPLRNMYLAALGSYYGDELCLGFTAGDRILDQSAHFGVLMEGLLHYLYSPQWWNPKQREIKINLDYKKYTKEELLCLYYENGGHLDKAFEESFSCYNPDINGNECWDCKPCFRKFVTFARFNKIFDEKIRERSINHIEHNILPLIKSNTYGRGKKEEDLIMKVYNRYK